jgi:hypothetical protein
MLIPHERLVSHFASMMEAGKIGLVPRGFVRQDLWDGRGSDQSCSERSLRSSILSRSIGGGEMSKRAPQFERMKNDFYPTPASAVEPLLPHLRPGTEFIEPCAGAGDLIDHLTSFGHHCVAACDIEPRRVGIAQSDALHWSRPPPVHSSRYCFITNPPWTRGLLHPLIRHLSGQHPTWLLFDADWMHTRQAAPYMALCQKIVSVGRVKWIPDSKFTGKDNACWYLFDANKTAPAQFIGRAA